jgi:hypothetical protein
LDGGKNGLSDVVIDLFGVPVVVRVRGRGRPAHEWTEEKSKRVKNMLALGKTQARIAAVLGISEPTLRKVYVSELKLKAIARDAVEAELFEAALEQARKGNVGAMKFAEAKLLDAARAKAAREAQGDSENAARDRAAARREATPKMGKKEAGVERARQVVDLDPDLQPSLKGLH